MYALSEAKKQELFGNYKEAFNLYKQCLQAESNSDAVLYQIANVYASIGEYDTAINYLKQAISINPSNVWYNLQLAQFYKLNNDLKDAIKSLKNSLDQQDKESILYEYNLANLYIEKEKFSKAEKLLGDIENRKGISEKVSVSKAILYSRQGNVSQSIHEIQKLILLDPDKTDYYGLVAEYCIDNQQYNEAKDYLSYLFEINPDDKRGLFVLANYYKETNSISQYDSLLTYIFKSSSISLNEKVEFFNKTFDKSSYKSDSVFIENCFDALRKSYKDDAGMYSFLSDYYIANKEYGAAKKELLKLKKYQYKNPLTWHQLLFVANIDNDSLLSNYADEALNYFPNEPIFIWFKGVGYYNNKDFDKAQRTLGSINIDNVPSKDLKIQFYILLGEIYNDLEKHAKSDVMFQKAIGLDKENFLILNNYSYYLALRKVDLDKAEKYSLKCVKSEPKNSTYLDTYAWVLFQQGEYNKAKKYIKRAIKFKGNDNAEILEHYGDILYKLGDMEGALEQWKTSQQLGNEKLNIDEKIK